MHIFKSSAFYNIKIHAMNKCNNCLKNSTVIKDSNFDNTTNYYALRYVISDSIRDIKIIC